MIQQKHDPTFDISNFKKKKGNIIKRIFVYHFNSNPCEKRMVFRYHSRFHLPDDRRESLLSVV